jgi:HK97 family phage prohead protease
MKLEYRAARELRSDGRTLYGLAAPYDQPAKIGSFTERIARGAFARTLRDKGDVMLCRDHKLDQVLARTANGSLVLDDAADGLRFRATLAEFSMADDALAQARAGLLAGCSIGFYVRDDAWNGGRDQRTLREIELIEISAVQAAVAYPQTSIAARSRAQGRMVPAAVIRRRLALAGL